MKKIIASFAIMISIFSYSNFIDKISQIDEIAKTNDYKTAYELCLILEATEVLDEDQKNTLESIKASIKSKLDIYENDLKQKRKILRKLIIAQKRREDFERIKEYEDMIVATEDSNLINDFAVYYTEIGLLEKAYKLALLDKNQTSRNLYLAATSLYMLGDYDKALKIYKKLEKREDKNPKIYLGLARVYKARQDYYRAIKNFNKYLEYENSPEVVEEINKLKVLE